MASVIQEIAIGSTADEVWKVIRDFEDGPARMAPGYVVGTRRDGDCRVVTFADGAVARERFVSVDDDARRIVYAIVGDSIRPVHDNASMQVVSDGEHGCRLIWIHDVLPDALAAPMEAAMTRGLAVIKRTLESRTTAA